MSYRRKASAPGTVPPDGIFAAMSSKIAKAWRSVVPKRSSSTPTMRATVSAWVASSGKAAFIRSTTAPVSSAEERPFDAQLLPVAHGRGA